MKNVVIAVVLMLGVVATADAQQLHGLGRIQGSVVDEQGAALTDVTVKATLPTAPGNIEGTSGKKGEWLIGGMARGEWDVVFEKAGYAPRKAKVSLPVELARTPAIVVTMKKQ